MFTLTIDPELDNQSKYCLSKKYSLRRGSKFANASVSLDSLVAGIFFNVVCKEIMFENI